MQQDLKLRKDPHHYGVNPSFQLKQPDGHRAKQGEKKGIKRINLILERGQEYERKKEAAAALKESAVDPELKAKP